MSIAINTNYNALATVLEAQALADGQTEVNFAAAVNGAAFYINGPDADNGRLLLGLDYTLDTGLNRVVLTNSYPAGTELSAVVNEPAGATAPGQIYLFNTVAELKAGVLSSGVPINLQIGAVTKTEGYYTPGDGGGASYIVKPSQAVDEYGDHTLDSGLVVILQITLATDVRAFGAVADADGTAGVGTDSTASINAIAVRGLPMKFPVGKFRITGPIGQGNDVYIGERFRSATGAPGSEIVCDGDAFSGVFVTMPMQIKDIIFQGTSLTGTGLSLENINPQNFLGWTHYENVRVRGFDLGVHVGNVFVCHIETVIVEENTKGIDVKPFNDAGDNGYVTTLYFDNVVIRENSQYGLDIAPDLKSPNIQFNNVNIENNGASGTFQWRMKNADPFVINNMYLENSPSIPAYLNAGGNVGSGEGLFINNTGGMSFGTGTATFNLKRVKQVGGEISATGGTNQVLKFEDSSIAFAGGLLPSISSLKLVNTIADAVTYNNYEKGSGVDFQIGNSSKISEIVSVQYTDVAGRTILANSGASIVSNVPITNIMENATAYGTFRDLYNNKVMLIVTTATTNSNDFYSIIAYNLAATDFIIPPNTVIDLVFIKSGN